MSSTVSRGLATLALLREALIPLAAAAAVVAVIVVSVALPAIIPSSRPGNPQSIAGGYSGGYSGGRLPAGQPPRFFVELPDGSNDLRVFNSATGQLTGRLAPHHGQLFSAVARLGSDRTFMAEAAPVGSNTTPSYGPCHTWLYQFRLTAQGRPTGLRPLAVPEVPGWPTGSTLQGDSLAASSDGSVVAYATQQCHQTGTIKQDGGHVAKYSGQLGVIRLASKTVTTWSFSSADWAGPASFSLSADGGLLTFVNYRSSGSRPNGLWRLRTDSAPGTLTRSARPVIPGSSALATALSPTGAVTFALTAAHVPGKSTWRVMLGAYAATTGQLLHVVKVVQHGVNLSLPGSVSPDAARRYLLVYGLNDQVQKLDLVTGRFTTLPATAKALNQPDSAAW